MEMKKSGGLVGKAKKMTNQNGLNQIDNENLFNLAYLF